MGTSLEMIERTYGHLVRGADDAFRLAGLDAFAATLDARRGISAMNDQTDYSRSAVAAAWQTITDVG